VLGDIGANVRYPSASSPRPPSGPCRSKLSQPFTKPSILPSAFTQRRPETAEHSLVLGGFVRTVLGYWPQAARDLIRLVLDYVTRPEQTVRWKWHEGDLSRPASDQGGCGSNDFA